LKAKILSGNKEAVNNAKKWDDTHRLLRFKTI
jgi:hypothetical protein